MPKLRTLVLATVAAFVLCTGSAMGITVSPTGSYTATSGTVRVGLSSDGQALTCTASSKVFTLAADGTGSFAVGNATYTSCRNPILGPVTFTQSSAWSVRVVLTGGAPVRIDIVITIPTNGLQIAGAGCTFSIGGTITKSASPSALPATISSAIVSASTLRITSNNGGPLCSLFPVGLALTYESTLRFSPSMVISG